MKKINLTISLLAIVLASSFLFANTAYADVHMIGDCSELAAIDDNTSVGNADSYILENDIFCTATFTPLAWSTSFSGDFDGNGKTIYGLKMTSSVSRSGMFASLSSANIHDLYLRDGSISGTQNVGSLAGGAGDSTITNVHSNLEVSGSGINVGGLIGSFAGGAQITSSSASGDVTGAGNVGGLIGRGASPSGQNALVTASWANGKVIVNATGNTGIGGLIGDVYANSDADPASVTISNSYASGEVDGTDVFGVGGLVGTATMATLDNEDSLITITNTYASGDVTGIGVGGLVGSAQTFTSANDKTIITNSFSLGEVNGTGGVGGLVGTQGGTDHTIQITNSTWSIPGSGQNNCMSPGAATCTGTNEQASYWFGTGTQSPVTTWSTNSNPWILEENSLPVLNLDEDFDAVPNSVENSGPNLGDANDDGIADRQQDNVKSYINDVTGNYLTLATDSGSVLDSFNIDGTGFVAQDSQYLYPIGFLSFTLKVEEGATANIDIYLEEDLPAQDITIRKYEAATEEYFDVTTTQLENITIGSTNVLHFSYFAIDGGVNDLDGLVDGFINDPVGPGTLAPLAATSAPSTTQVIPPTSNSVSSSAAGSLPSTGKGIFGLTIFALVLTLSGFALRRFRLSNLQ